MTNQLLIRRLRVRLFIFFNEFHEGAWRGVSNKASVSTCILLVTRTREFASL